MTALLAVEAIDVFYGASQILFGVSFELLEGQSLALLGRNGAGKSTTMKAIIGLAPHAAAASACAGRNSPAPPTASPAPASATSPKTARCSPSTPSRTTS